MSKKLTQDEIDAIIQDGIDASPFSLEKTFDAECLKNLKLQEISEHYPTSLFCNRTPQLNEYPIDIQASYIIMLSAIPVVILLLILSSAIRRWKMGNTTKRNKMTFWCALITPMLLPVIESTLSGFALLSAIILLLVSLISWFATPKRTGAEKWGLRIFDISIYVFVIVFIIGQVTYTKFQNSDAKILKRQVYWDYIEQKDSSK